MTYLFRGGLLLGCIQLFLLWGTGLPLGVPGEWTWARSGVSVIELWNVWPALLTGIPLMLLVTTISRRCEQASRNRMAMCLVALWLAGVLWTLAALSSIPGIAGISRIPFVLFYTRSSGYFTQARDEARDVQQFLATYRERIADSSLPENYLHMGTHPPGLTIAFRGLLQLCEASPSLRTVLQASQPGSVRESFELIRTLTAHDPHPLLPADEAAIWLAGVLVLLMSTGTCIPLYLLARRTVFRQGAWWAAAFWLLVPAVAVFFPKSDVMFPCLAMWIQWIWLEGVDRQSIRWGAVAGLLMFIAVCLTLAFVPLGLMLVLQGLFVPSRQAPAGSAFPAVRKRLGKIRVFLGSGAVFLAGIAIAYVCVPLNLVDVWLQNLRNHAAFYQHATRSYRSWLIENPIELSCSLGLPLALLAIAGVVLTGMNLRRTVPAEKSQGQGVRTRAGFDLLIPLAVWGLLWGSGKNMGEAARLWCFLMPFAVWGAAPVMQRMLGERSGARWLCGLFLIQMAVSLGTMLQIDGFHFAELLPS